MVHSGSFNREDAKNAKSGPASSMVTPRRWTARIGVWLHLAAGGSHFVSFASSRFKELGMHYLTGIEG
jgi:hypothetical protein